MAPNTPLRTRVPQAPSTHWSLARLSLTVSRVPAVSTVRDRAMLLQPPTVALVGTVLEGRTRPIVQQMAGNANRATTALKVSSVHVCQVSNIVRTLVISQN